jgi:hypothetical protein
MDHPHRSTACRRRPAVAATATLVAVALLVVGALWSPSAGAVPDPGAAEAEFVARINQLRASKGLGALSVDGELTTLSRQWASTMAGHGRIFHASQLSAGVTSNWQKLGENVGVGGDVATLFQAFVDSPSHYDNLIDPAYTRVGVGVVVSGDRIFTTHRFMGLAPAPPPPPPPPPPTTAAPTTVPPTTVPPTTAPPTTAPPTTAPPVTSTTVAPTDPAGEKLGPLERIAELVGPQR